MYSCSSFVVNFTFFIWIEPDKYDGGLFKLVLINIDIIIMQLFHILSLCQKVGRKFYVVDLLGFKVPNLLKYGSLANKV